MLYASTADANASLFSLFQVFGNHTHTTTELFVFNTHIKLTPTEPFVRNTSYMSLLCCRFVVCDLFFKEGKDCVYCTGTIEDNDIFIGLCKTPALCMLHTLQEALYRPGRASSGRTEREVQRKGSGGTEEERRLAHSCISGSPRFGLGIDLHTFRVCSRVYRGHPVDSHTQLICIWFAPGV